MPKIKIVTENHIQDICDEVTAWIRKALADSEDISNYFDSMVCDAEPGYTISLDGQQIYTTINPDLADYTINQPPVGGIDALQRLDTARHTVIKAALNLAAVEWGNGRETASDSMDLDFACDLLDTALNEYGDAHIANTTPTPPAYPAHGSPIPDQPGYVVATCGHRIAASEWRAGYRTCERCPEATEPQPETVPEHVAEIRTWLTQTLLAEPVVADAFLIGDDGDELGLRTAGREYRIKVIPA